MYLSMVDNYLFKKIKLLIYYFFKHKYKSNLFPSECCDRKKINLFKASGKKTILLHLRSNLITKAIKKTIT